MGARVLVLNRGYQPVAVCGIERAFGLLYSGAAHALDENYEQFDYDAWSKMTAGISDDVIRTVNTVIKIPRILVLKVFNKVPRNKVKFSRNAVYLRDRHTCQYCARKLPRSKLNLDHVVPKVQGGKMRWDNIVCSCIRCNVKKGGRTPEQAQMPLLKKPQCPGWASVISNQVETLYNEWLPFNTPKK